MSIIDTLADFSGSWMCLVLFILVGLVGIILGTWDVGRRRR